MLAEQDPIAIELLNKYNNLAMPNLRLTGGDVASIIAYLESTANVAAPAQSSQAPSAATSGGDSVKGKNLFTGTSRLQNGGPSCRACHTATGIGALGGGSLGPDLTGSYNKLGDALITWPRTTAPMAAIFSDKPLTPEEEADLLAFFEAASVVQRPSQAIWQLSGLALAGLVVFAVIAQLVWRRRLRKVREPMVAGQASRRS
jgi:mono/diheme cytochrome c family protein